MLQQTMDNDIKAVLYPLYCPQYIHNQQITALLAERCQAVSQLLLNQKLEIVPVPSIKLVRQIEKNKFLDPAQHKMFSQKTIEQHSQLLKRKVQQQQKINARQLQDLEYQNLMEQQIQLMQREQRRRRAWLSFKQIQDRDVQRKQIIQQSQIKVKQIKGFSLLHDRFEKNYQSMVLKSKRDQQKVLQLNHEQHKPINHQSLRQHQRFFIKMRKQKTQRHLEQIKESLDQGTFKPNFKLRVAEIVRAERQRLKLQIIQKQRQPMQKLRKIQLYKKYVRDHHLPAKKEQMQTVFTDSTVSKKVVSISHYQVGKKYLQQIRQLNKEVRASSRVQAVLHSDSKISRAKSQTKNYLQRHPPEYYSNVKAKRIDNIISKCQNDKEQLANLMSQIERMDEQLKRREVLARNKVSNEDTTAALIDNLAKKLQALQKI